MNRENTQKKVIEEKSKEKLKSYKNSSSLVKTEILGVGITNASKENILEFIVNSLENSRTNYYITTPNPEMLVYTRTHPELCDILNNAEIALCDGVGVLAAASFLDKPLAERFTGVDLVEKLCEKVSNRPITIGFFGAGPKVAERTAQCLQERYPRLKIVSASDTWEEPKADLRPSQLSVNASVSRSKPNAGEQPVIGYTSSQLTSGNSIDILFVALGFPKQELWMAQHVGKVPVRVMVGVGGAFDYISGKVGRAPVFVRKMGLEWFYRLLKQPWRLKRQLALPIFVWMVLREKLASISTT